MLTLINNLRVVILIDKALNGENIHDMHCLTGITTLVLCTYSYIYYKHSNTAIG